MRQDPFEYIRRHYGAGVFKGARCLCKVAGAGVYAVVGVSGSSHLKIKKPGRRAVTVHPLDIVPEFEVCQRFAEEIKEAEKGEL